MCIGRPGPVLERSGLLGKHCGQRGGNGEWGMVSSGQPRPSADACAEVDPYGASGWRIPV